MFSISKSIGPETETIIRGPEFEMKIVVSQSGEGTPPTLRGYLRNGANWQLRLGLGKKAGRETWQRCRDLALQILPRRDLEPEFRKYLEQAFPAA